MTIRVPEHAQQQRPVMSPAEVLALPVTVDVPTAGRCFGIGRDAAYDLARSGALPVPILRLGRRLVVTRASLLAALGIPDSATAAPTNATAANNSPDGATDDSVRLFRRVG